MEDKTNHQSVNPTEPVACIGLDWGHREHAVALEDSTGRKEENTLKHSAESLHGWLSELAQRYGGHPVTSARYRTAFTPSGASDDLPDARVLLELVRNHRSKLRPLERQDAQTQQLRALVQARRDMVDRRTQVLNQLTSLLRSYYPQVLELVGDLDSTLAVDFLKRWPDMLALKAAKPGTIERFYYARNVRRPELVEQRLQSIKSAVALTTNLAQIKVNVLQLRLLLDQLQAFRHHIPIIEAEIKRVFSEHSEAALFRDLPGAGPQLAPRLCVVFGTVRTLYPEPAAVQKLSGVAPVREKSGQQLWTHWRWLAPVFTRQTFVEWAGQTVVYSAWARRYYQAMKAKGKPRHVILRALAFKWIRILWKCWQDRTPYDEARYLKQLLHRKSPYALA